MQYAHARIAVDPAQPRRTGRSRRRSAPTRAASTLNDAERELVRRLLAFPNEVREAVERRAPHRIASYALELGQAFAAFYRDSPVLKEPDEALQAFRIALCVASQRTLAALARPARRLRPGVDVMLDSSTSSRVPARLPAPYVHVDNRGLVLCNGPQCVSIPARSCARAPRRSRSSPPRGARRAARARTSSAATSTGGDVVLYAGTQDDLLSVTLNASDFGSLREAIGPPR